MTRMFPRPLRRQNAEPGPDPGPAAPEARRPGHGRMAAVWALIAVASVLGLAAILVTWVNRQMFDDHNWTTANQQLIQDPTVQAALSTYLVNALYTNVDVPGALAEKLPKNLKPLAEPAAAALRQPATSAMTVILARPRVQALFLKSSTVTHHQLVNLLDQKSGYGVTNGKGQVTIDLSALLKDIAPEIGLPQKAVAKIPPNAGVITLMRSDQLRAAQTGVRVIRVASVWLVVLVFALYALALYLAVGKRRETLRNIGWSFVFVGLLVLVVRRLTGNYVVDTLAMPQYKDATREVWLTGSSILGEVGRAFVLYGIIFVLGAMLAGPTRAAIATRRRIAPVLNAQQELAWGVVAFAFLLLILWGGTHALRTPIGILVLAGLLVLGVLALRRQTLVEFPVAEIAGAPAGEEAPSATVAAVSAWLRPRREAPPASTPSNGGPAADLARLAELHDSGALTDDEYARAKQLALS